LDSKFLNVILNRGGEIGLHFLEQAIPILLKNKNGIVNGEELGIPLISYYTPVLERNPKQTLLNGSNNDSNNNDDILKKSNLIINNEKDIYK